MTSTISIGGATFDLFIQTVDPQVATINGVESFLLPTGAKIPVKDVVESCGGGASNTSVGLARLGCNASFCGILASDQWGEALQKNFIKEDVDFSTATIIEKEVSSFSLVLSSPKGERTILYTAGSNTHLHDANFNKTEIQKNDWIYFNHIQEHSSVIENDIAELANNEHVSLVWNPGGCQLKNGANDSSVRTLLQLTNVLQLNKEEALQFTRQSHTDQAIKMLLEYGCKYVCITDGSNGTIAATKNEAYWCGIAPTTVVDTTGAGDAFGVGMLWGIASGNDLPSALQSGSINAASVVSHLGAQTGLLTDIELRHRLASQPIHVSEYSLS